MSAIRRTVLAVFAGVAGALVAGPVLAQPYPTKPIRIVVPFGTGSVTDTLMRAMQNELGAALGQPLVIENRAGAGGTVGTATVARAAPDGYTLLSGANSHNINGSVYSNLSYSPLKDFTGVALVGTTGYVLIVNAAVPARTTAEFIQYAKAHPGQLNYATAGKGSATHLSMAYLISLAGLDIVHIPTKSTGDALTEVIAGRSQVMIASNIAALPFAHDARVRLIGVTSAARTPFLPDVPPIAESGLPGYSFDSWLGLLAPAGTPREVTERLNTEIGKLLKQPVILERFARLGVEPRTATVEQFNQMLHEDYDNMARVVKAAGAKND